MERTPPGAGNTPSTPVLVANLAAAVEGGNWGRTQLQSVQPGVTCIIYPCARIHCRKNCKLLAIYTPLTYPWWKDLSSRWGRCTTRRRIQCLATSSHHSIAVQGYCIGIRHAHWTCIRIQFFQVVLSGVVIKWSDVLGRRHTAVNWQLFSTPVCCAWSLLPYTIILEACPITWLSCHARSR